MTVNSNPANDSTNEAGSNLDAVYQQVILQHNRHPVGFNQTDGASFTVEGHNPVCGDHVSMGVFFDDGKTVLQSVAFALESCAICTASASLLCQQLQQLPVNQVIGLADEFINFIQQGSELHSETLEPMQAFAELHRLPTRQRCATLPWETLLKMLQESNE